MNLKDRFLKRLRKLLDIRSPSEEILKLTSVWAEDLKTFYIATEEEEVTYPHD